MKRSVLRWSAWSWVLLWAVTAPGQAPNLERMDVVLKSVPDGPVAKVRGVSIPADDFRSLYERELAALTAQSRGATVDTETRVASALRCLGLLVQREILCQEAQRRGLKVTEAELNAAWEDELDFVREGVRKRSGGDETLPEAELLKMAGLSREEARAEVRKELLIEKVRKALAKEAGVKVTDKEIRALFDEKKDLFKRPDRLHLRQIFVAFGGKGETTPAERAQAEEKIQKALKRIRAGETFAGVARDMSEAPDRAKGGDLGMLPLNVIPPFLRDAALELEPGEVSSIVESDLGFHLVQMVDFTPGEEPNFDRAKETIETMLFNQESNQVVEDFCEPVMKEKGAVQVFLELEQQLATLPENERPVLSAPSEEKTP